MSQSFYESLEIKEQEFFDLYKSNGQYLSADFFANDLNRMLCEGNNDPDWQSAIDVLDSITSKHILPQETTLYRITSEELFLGYIDPVVIPYPAFMSTSSDEEAVKTHYSSIESENAVLLRISAPAGYPLALLEHEQTSGMEKEFLLGRNTKFVLTGRNTYTGKSDIAYFADREFVQYLSKLIIIDLTIIL